MKHRVKIKKQANKNPRRLKYNIYAEESMSRDHEESNWAAFYVFQLSFASGSFAFAL